MSSEAKDQKLTGQQQRILQLLFKFRFVSAGLLADVMGIRKPSVYEVLGQLVGKDLVTKVYKSSFRIDRKPAYYYLNKSGVTAVRKVMGVKESVVHTLYKNADMADDFIDHCLKLAQCYVSIKKYLPEGSDVFTKTEINRFSQFPKTRPDMYIRTSDGNEAMIVIVDDRPLYIVRKRLDETLEHSEDEGWDGNYPHICFILRNPSDTHSFLYTTEKKLEGIGLEEDELTILAAPMSAFDHPLATPWSTPYRPKEQRWLFQ